MARGTNSLYSRLLANVLYETDEEDDSVECLYSTLLARSINLKTNEEASNRYHVESKKKHVAVQTDPKVKAEYAPWLMEIETKTGEFCTELNNLLNSFYNSFLEETKRPVSDKNKALRERLQKIRDQIDMKTRNNIIEYADSSTRALTYSRANVFTDMEAKLKSLLKSAEAVRNSIPVMYTETATKIETEVQVSAAKVAENTRELIPGSASMVSSSSHNLKQALSKPQSSKTEPFMVHIKPEKSSRIHFKSQKPRHGPIRSAVGGRAERPKNFTGERTSPPANMPDLQKQTQQEQPGKTLTGSDKERNQGAIRKRQINRSVPTAKSTGESSRNPNSKKTVTQKPMWR